MEKLTRFGVCRVLVFNIESEAPKDLSFIWKNPQLAVARILSGFRMSRAEMPTPLGLVR